MIVRVYRLDDFIDSGKYGSVWAATNTRNFDQVAIKFLSGEFADNKKVADFFKQEFQILKQLKHPNINRVYDFGLDTKYGYFFANELINGTNIFTATEKLSVEKIEALFVQIFRALAYLHSRGIMHFDIKAKNVLVENALTDDARARLIDFGVAAFESPEKPRGTPSYMAPEMILLDKPDGRADLYSLGVLMYYCLTRKNPFRGIDNDETYQNQLNIFPKKPSEINPKIPQYLDLFIVRLLQKEPEMRYPSAVHAINDLNMLSPREYKIETEETKFCYIPSDSIFVGRTDANKKINNALESLKKGSPDILITSVSGSDGTGKTSFLRHIKHNAQLSDINVIEFMEEDDRNFDIGLEQLGGALTEKKRPTLVLIDDLERILETSSGPIVKRLLNHYILQATAEDYEPPTPIAIVYTTDPRFSGDDRMFVIPAKAGIKNKIILDNFTDEEIREFLIRMSSPPEEHLPNLTEEFKKRTRGNPQLVTQLAVKLVRHGFIGGTGGLWEKSNFDDIAIKFADIDIPSSILEQAKLVVSKLDHEEHELLLFVTIWGKPVSLDELEGFFKRRINRNTVFKLESENLIKLNSENYCYLVFDDFIKITVLGSIEKQELCKLHDHITAHLLASEKPDLYLIDLHLSKGSDKNKADLALLRLSEFERRNNESLRALHRIEKRINEGFDFDVKKESQFVLEMCRCLDFMNRQDKSIDVCRGKISYFEEKGLAPILLAELYAELGYDQIALHRVDEGKAALEKALTLYEISGNSIDKQLIIKNRIARALALQRKYKEAVDIYKNTLRLQKKLSAEKRKSVTNNELGHTFWMMGDYRKAKKWLKKEIKFYEISGKSDRLAHCHYTLAEIYKRGRKFKRTVRELNKAIEISKNIQRINLLTASYNSLGTAYEERGKTEKAIEYYSRALSLSHRMNNPQTEAIISTNIGQAYNRLGQIEKAKNYLNSVYAFVHGEKAGTGWVENVRCGAALRLADIAVKSRDFERAERLLLEAEELASSREELKLNLGAIFMTRAELFREKFKAGSNERHLNEAQKYLDEARKYITTPAAEKDLKELEKSLKL